MTFPRPRPRFLAKPALACAAVIGLGAAMLPAALLAQDVVNQSRVERIHSALQPNPNAAADHANRIIQMAVPAPGGGYTDVTLNYNYSIDLAVFYAFDSADLTPETQALLTDLGLALRSPELAGLTFLIAGHTDAKGSKPYNQDLSERRAIEARRFLVERFGIPPRRLYAVGFGEDRLADPQRPRDGINRRVEITLIQAVGAAPVVHVPSGAGGGAGGGAVVTGGHRLAECAGVDPNADPRPKNTGLDDFGGQRTELPCGNPHGGGGVVQDPILTPADQLNSAINN